MPVPGSAGSVWAADTWAADTWTEDSWDGAVVPPDPPAPAPTGSGGIARVSRKEVEAIERLLRQRGRIKASAAAPEAIIYGTVRNPTPVVVPRRAKVVPVVVPEPQPEPVPEPEKEPELPPEPRTGVVTAGVAGVVRAVGLVSLQPHEEIIAATSALHDPLFDWIMRELDL